MLTKRFILTLTSVWLLFSCNKAASEIQFISPDNNIKIHINTLRYSSLDPWKVEIQVKGFEYDETLQLEIFQTQITKETVLVDWKEQNGAIITFTQTDGVNRVLDLHIEKGHIKLAEI